MSDLDYTEALEKLVVEAQKEEKAPWQYALMFAVFYREVEDNEETNRMAVSLAKQAIE